MNINTNPQHFSYDFLTGLTVVRELTEEEIANLLVDVETPVEGDLVDVVEEPPTDTIEE